MSFGIGRLGSSFGRLGRPSGKKIIPFPFAPGGTLPSHDIDFAGGRAYANGSLVTPSSLLTVTRASQETITDTSGNLTYASNNTAALSNAGLQAWEARTNLLLGSADFTGANAAWSMTGATTAILGAAPDSATAANVTTEDTSTGSHVTFGQGGNLFAASAGATLTYSIYLKAGTRRFVWLGVSDQANSYFYATVDTQNWTATSGTVVGAVTPTVGTPVLTALANGWYRVSVTGTLPTITAYQPFVAGATSANAALATYTGTNSTWITWGAQVEAAAFVGPYIPTTSATVTRAADVITLTAPPSFGSAYSTAAWGTPSGPLAFATNQELAQIDDGSNNNRLILDRVASTGLAQFVSISAGTGMTGGATAWAQNALGKLGVSDTASSQIGVFNGGAPFTKAGALPVGVNTVRIGSNTVGASQWNGAISRLLIWPTTALSAGALQQVTR